MKKFAKGFTVIEVTLVLAIAGLIFLMMFVALPGLRVSQRDSQRRDDIAMFLESVKKYQTNNRGALPGAGDNTSGPITVTWSQANNSAVQESTWRGFYRDYLKEKFVDPDGDNYALRIVQCPGTGSDCGANANLAETSFPNGYTILVVKQASCSGEKSVPTKNPRKIAVLYKLEGAGIYCSNT